MNISPAEIATLLMSLAALVTAYAAWRKSHSESEQAESNADAAEMTATRAITEAATGAVELTRQSTDRVIADLEAEVAEFRGTIASLNAIVRDLRISGEQGSLTLHNALNAMDMMRSQILLLQSERLELIKTITELSTNITRLEGIVYTLRDELARYENLAKDKTL